MSDDLKTTIESLCAKLGALELDSAEQAVMAVALDIASDEVEGFAYDLNPNELFVARGAYDLNPNELSFKLARSLGIPSKNTSDADIGPV